MRLCPTIKAGHFFGYRYRFRSSSAPTAWIPVPLAICGSVRRGSSFLVVAGPPSPSVAELFAGTFCRVGTYQDHQLQIFPMRRPERNLVEHQAPARRMIEFARTAFPFADVL
ncbi:hypothetical protein SAMN05414139_01143 [Burkholderia sp. D7]|nr:hypothetical protein SAMN05414139_01143 [Burkholderia sp. D7]